MSHPAPPVTRNAAPILHVVGAAILRHDQCLATQRGAQMSNPLKWEFPGGKVLPGEDPRRALEREIREELAIEIAVEGRLGWGESLIDGRRILLEVYLARWTSGELELLEHRDHRWLGAAELEHLDWAAADRPLLPNLSRILRSRARLR